MSEVLERADKKRQKITQKRFLFCLVESLGIISNACDRVGISRGTHYHWLKTDPEYATAFRKAQLEAEDAQFSMVEAAASKCARKPCKQMQKFILKEFGQIVLDRIMAGETPELIRRNHS